MKYLILFIFICSNAFADIRLSCEITYSAGFKVDNANRNYYAIIKNGQFIEFNFLRDDVLADGGRSKRNGLSGNAFVYEVWNEDKDIKVVATLDRVTGQLTATYYNNANKRKFVDTFICDVAKNKF